jgi:hypothetical protein
MMDFYLAIKKNEILSFASKWVELENMIINKVSQFRKSSTACFFSYVEYRCNTNKSIIIYIEKNTEHVSKRGA